MSAPEPDPVEVDEECPLCINPLSKAELNWYPCNCGYQICLFCFNECMNRTGLCPKCRSPFAPDAKERVGSQFRPKRNLNSERVQTVAPSYVSTRIVQISGLPNVYFSASILARPEFLGQYGQIEAMLVGDSPAIPTSRSSMPPPASCVFVKFTRPLDARACVLALNGALIAMNSIQASLAIVQVCPKTVNGGTCDIKDCMKVHGQPTTADVSANGPISPPLEFPPDYYDLPTKGGCFAVFPQPRLIPATTYPFLHRNLYPAERISLLEIACRKNGALPAPKPTVKPTKTPSSLTSILHLAPMVA
jgi:CCR4-NOT transcription complex subunit 4